VPRVTHATIDIVAGPGAGRRVSIDGPKTIGRAGDCDIVLTDAGVSSHHARVTPREDGVDLEDLGSTNGTWINGVPIGQAVHLTSGYQFTLGSSTLRVIVGEAEQQPFSTIALYATSSPIPVGDHASPAASELYESAASAVAVLPPPPAPTAQQAPTGDLTDELIATDIWSDEMVARAGIPIIDTPFVTIGGGLGSFVMVDYLRIAGVPIDQIKVLTVLDYPWQTYEYLTGASQIPPTEVLRSDSGSCPDNIWGFPSYAARATFDKFERLPGQNFLAPMWNVLTENIFCDYWTPKSGQVFRALQREADRINYWPAVVKGQARMVRRRHGGGYFSIHTPPAGSGRPKREAYRSTYVHLSVGYPGLKFLDDLQDYRNRTGDTHRIVNAYEPHEHVYDEINRKGGKVVVRGAGIVGSRILQRLMDDRDAHNNNVQILHLFRTYVDGPTGDSIFMRRPGGRGWSYQGFNWPKACWTGQYRAKMQHLEGEALANFYRSMDGTTTPYRRYWQKQLAKGRNEGFYQTFVGTVSSFEPGPDGTINTIISTKTGDQLTVDANFVIDGTGLEADIREHRLLADLLDHSGVGRNPLGRLDVSREFVVRGAENAPGRMYAAGSSTLGAYFATVDSFLGLQYAALQACDDLARQGFCKHIGPARSIAQWSRWMKRQAP